MSSFSSTYINNCLVITYQGNYTHMISMLVAIEIENRVC